MDLYTDSTAAATRDTTPTGGTPGYFTDGIVGTKARTVLRGWFMQLLVDEIRNVIVGAGITPSITVNNQLLAAIQALIASGAVPFASSSDVITGTSTTKAVTPASLTGAISLGSSGYYKLPGGFLLQWGSTPSHSQDDGAFSVSLPTSFTSACYAAYATDYNPTADTGADSYIQVVSLGTSAIQFMVQAPSSTPTGTTAQGFYFAIGK